MTVLVPVGVAAREASTSYIAFIHFLVYMALSVKTFSADIIIDEPAPLITENETFSDTCEAPASFQVYQK